jgi:hypothetical protein
MIASLTQKKGFSEQNILAELLFYFFEELILAPKLVDSSSSG